MSLATHLGTYTEFTPKQKATTLAILHVPSVTIFFYTGLVVDNYIAIGRQRAKRWHNRSKFKQLTSLSYNSFAYNRIQQYRMVKVKWSLS